MGFGCFVLWAPAGWPVCVCMCELANVSSVHLSSAFLLTKELGRHPSPQLLGSSVEIQIFHGEARGVLLRPSESSSPSGLQILGPAEG